MASQLKTVSSASQENFADLLDEFFSSEEAKIEGKVIPGRVIRVENDIVIIDVGLKSEGRIPLREFQGIDGKTENIHSGDTIKVFVEKMDSKTGETLLSRDKAKKEEVWVALEELHKKGERVNGVIFGKVKGGFTVDLSGIVAFLPGSQIDVRPIRDVSPIMGISQPFQILKIDRLRGNIVVSRRAILEESRLEARSELVANIKEGQVLQGVVKNITDYGAFIDLGGVDGLLHVTDISWKRISHPSEVLTLGATIDVKVIRFNEETKRISLGMKQLVEDPWQGIEQRFPISSKLKGKVCNLTDYGAFVELEPGIEGLVHVTEMSWIKKNVPPSKLVELEQEVEVVVLEIDQEKRRISLGMKQLADNPWSTLIKAHPVGSVVEGPIRNITEFGLFIGLTDDIDGLIHLSDLSWTEAHDKALASYKVGDTIQAKVLEVDADKERICLGVKQLTDDPIEGAFSKLTKGEVVTGTISEISNNGISVVIGDNVQGFIKKADLSRERNEQRTDRFAVGEKIDAKITSIEKANRKVTLSIKARELEEEKRAMEQFGSSDSGASLGDILGAALKNKSQASKTAEEEAKPKKSAAKKTTVKKTEDTAEKPAKKKKAKAATTEAEIAE